MTDNIIKLNKKDTLRLDIQTADGEDTGEFLEFDLTDIELPLIYQEIIEKDKKNREYLHNSLMIIDKREDVKGKKLLSKNEEDKLRAIKAFFNKEVEIYNMFLGERGVEKLLNGRSLTWNSLNEIDKIIQEQIVPHLDLEMENIESKIKEKYQTALDKSKEVLE